MRAPGLAADLGRRLQHLRLAALLASSMSRLFLDVLGHLGGVAHLVLGGSFLSLAAHVVEGVLTRTNGSFTDVETPIPTHDHVKVNDNRLNDEVGHVEPGFAVVPRETIQLVAGGEVVSCATPAGTKGQKSCREENHVNLGAEFAGSEVVDRRGLGPENTEKSQRNGEEPNYSEVGQGCLLDVMVDIARVRAESVEQLDGAGNGHDDHQKNRGVYTAEGDVDTLVPSKLGVKGASDPVEQDEVDHVQHDSTGGDQDLGSDLNVDVGEVVGPRDAQRAGDDAHHREPNKLSGGHELAVDGFALLEEAEIEDHGDEVDDKED